MENEEPRNYKKSEIMFIPINTMFDKDTLELGCRIDHVNKVNLAKAKDDLIQISFINHMIRWDLEMDEEINHLLDYCHLTKPELYQRTGYTLYSIHSDIEEDFAKS